jgi:hypothetical protein
MVLARYLGQEQLVSPFKPTRAKAETRKWLLKNEEPREFLRVCSRERKICTCMNKKKVFVKQQGLENDPNRKNKILQEIKNVKAN